MENCCVFLELKINLARKISDHVQMILDNKEFIVSTLQQPLVGDFIKAGAEFHKYHHFFAFYGISVDMLLLNPCRCICNGLSLLMICMHVVDTSSLRY